MGIAKTMSAVGEYTFYSSNHGKFIEKLGKLFHVNILARFFETTIAEEESFGGIEDKYFDFRFSETFYLDVGFFNYDESALLDKNKYCIYELRVPVHLEHEDELTLSFNPNGFFQLGFLPFSNYWANFIEDIIGLNDRYHESHEEIVSAIYKIRKCYIEILKMINCSEIIIWTDAYYKTEEKFILDQKINKKNVLNELKKGIKELDGINIVPFMEAINQEIKIKSREKNYLDIAFHDKF